MGQKLYLGKAETAGNNTTAGAKTVSKLSSIIRTLMELAVCVEAVFIAGFLNVSASRASLIRRAFSLFVGMRTAEGGMSPRSPNV